MFAGEAIGVDIDAGHGSGRYVAADAEGISKEIGAASVHRRQRLKVNSRGFRLIAGSKSPGIIGTATSGRAPGGDRFITEAEVRPRCSRTYF